MLRVVNSAWGLRAALALAIALTLLLVYFQASRASDEHAAATQHVPLAEPAGGYTSSTECRACHAEQYASWYASYHRTMTQEATPATVRGNFSNVALAHGKERILLSQQGDEFMLDVLTPAAPEKASPALQPVSLLPEGRYPVKLVTGSHHMQVYWFETGKGRSLGQVPFAYLHEDARWVPRHMLFLRPPQLFRSGENGRWNSTCLHCHSTRAEPRLSKDGEHDTRVAELGIACEACHGPGRAHISQLSSPVARYASHFRAADDGDTHAIVNPSKIDAGRASAICSQCHAIWQPKREVFKALNQTGSAYRPGDDPEKTSWLFAPSRKGSDERVRSAMRQDAEYAPGQFWSDGQARVSGREYNGMIESACMHSGQLSCMSCHSMHREHGDKRSDAQWADDQLKERADAACTNCHQNIGEAVTAHTKHSAGSAGSSCYNCHMPHTSWGLLKAMRTHRIGNPSVSETLDTGRPNACTLCHLDKSLRWTATMLETRFGAEPVAPQLLAAPEYGLATGVAMSLLGDAGQRALLAAAMRRPEVQKAAGTAWMPAVLGILMDDPYDAVRYVAGHALQTLPGFENYAYDFVRRPRERPEVADDIAELAAPELLRAQRAGQLSDALPFTPGGVLAPDQTRSLLSRRDQRPVHLLE
ncbi:MAG TPA: multiheme c-type cytochrome [Polyangiales bacterium]|nr:multiheme c-type cytochrome [Polyangiales bacterium]